MEGRSRKYTDEAAVAKIVKEAGYEPYEQKLLGITAMTGLLGKSKFEELLDSLVVKPQGKSTFAPMSDKRPVMNTAAEDFGILLFGYSVDGGAVEVIDIANGEQIPQEILDALTALENPNSVAQMKAWLKERGVEAESLDKKSVISLLKTARSPVSDVLALRQQLAKSSVKKYQAIRNAACADSRVRGMFQFYGANRTGRFAGRIVQLQNLPQNHLADLEYARALVRQSNSPALELLYDSVPDVLSQLIRTAFIPKAGRKFIVADFSAIEARVLSWLAKERWRMDVFVNNGDIYCATAGRMFHCNVVKHGENEHLRQKRKQTELACGYGGSVGALKAFGHWSPG